jgi:hypothetical protein
MTARWMPTIWKALILCAGAKFAAWRTRNMTPLALRVSSCIQQAAQRVADVDNWSNIMERLESFRRHNGEVDCDGVRWPSAIAIEVAAFDLELEIEFGFGAKWPAAMVCTGDGGVLLTWTRSNRRIEREVDIDGSVERRTFRDGKLVERCKVITDA